MDSAITSLLAETDIEFARSGLESELKLLEGLILSYPDDVGLLTTAAQGFTGYALMYLEENEPDRAVNFYERARLYGLRALAERNTGFSDLDLNYRQFTVLLGSLKSSDMPAAYWTAMAWGARINLERSSASALAESPRAIALMEWVYERDPHFYYSGPLWFLGKYYVSLPPLMGGGISKAELYFTQALESDGDRFLLGKVIYAESYVVMSFDRDLFVRMLKEVILSNSNAPAELNLLNAVAKRRAEALLKKTDELFE